MSCPLRPEANGCPAEEVELVELDGGGGVDAGSSGGRSGVYGVRGGVERGVGVVGYSMQACYQVTTHTSLCPFTRINCSLIFRLYILVFRLLSHHNCVNIFKGEYGMWNRG